MLEALSIRNFLLIDRLDLSFDQGFIALTGETGAGKSIILDALALLIGGAPDRRHIRIGSERSSVSAAFALSPEHAAWSKLNELGIEADPRELLLLKRLVPLKGPSRAYVNDQPVSSAVLAAMGTSLLEIHGQHAAAALMKSSTHRTMLDQFADTQELLTTCASAWTRRLDAEARLQALLAETAASAAEFENVKAARNKLAELAPEPGEADRLNLVRTRLLQAGRLSDHLREAGTALNEGSVSEAIAVAARKLEQICRLPGYDQPETALGLEALAVRDGLERALIELQEAERGMAVLADQGGDDPSALDEAEGRLFALRAAARRHGVGPDELMEVLSELDRRLADIETSDLALQAVEQEVKSARADWHAAANMLSRARRAASKQLEARVHEELQPLKLGRAKFRVRFAPIDDGDSGLFGAETIVFEWQANGLGKFGPVSKVASGGELARVCLALQCALAGDTPTATLIFDEADQGVGGAVAAAIGERLSRLGEGRQVLAITHSPQVAAAAGYQWSVSKTLPRKGLGRTLVTGLDGEERLEEIARMLAGAEVTLEARAAAERLLEDGCQPKKRPRK